MPHTPLDIQLINPLMPNALQVHGAASPLYSQQLIYTSQTVCHKFGRILFTPIWLTAVACYASGPLKVRLSFRSQSVPLLPPKLLHKHQYICILSNCAYFQATMVLTLLALTVTCSGVHCGLKYQHWPMKQTSC